MKRWIMHVDMDAFYASVEQRDYPEYKNKPVIVGGLSSRGVVATASYEARAFGVRSAMASTKAHELCPNGIFVRPRMAVYKAVSAQIHRIFERYTPYIEPLSLDEAFLEVSGMDKLYATPKAMGLSIKADIFKETGLHASVGIAPNKFLAKIGSDLDKPNGLVIVPYGMEKAFLKPLPIRRLWGVGKVTEQALLKAGYKTIGDIAALPDDKALLKLCGNQAKRIYELSQGIDDRPVEYERPMHSLGNEETYLEDLTEPADIDREWRYFASHVSKRLRKEHLTGRTITIKVRFSSFKTITKQCTIENATNNEDTLYLLATSLYNKIVVSEPIRLLGLTVSHFEAPLEQLSLFGGEDAKKDLSKTLDSLEARFGQTVVMKGSLWERELSRQNKRGEGKDD